MVKHLQIFFASIKKALTLNLVYSMGTQCLMMILFNDNTIMTVDLLMVWSNLCPSCYGNTRSCMMFADMQELFLSDERIVAYGPLVLHYGRVVEKVSSKHMHAAKIQISLHSSLYIIRDHI